MSRITRAIQKIFGGLGNSTYFGVFGSKQLGAPVNSKDLTTIQSLAPYDTGLQDAVASGDKAPRMEDINALFLMLSQQIAYQFQEGVAEWETNTSYFTNSIVKKPGTLEIYASLVDNNIGNTLPSQTDNTQWHYCGSIGNIIPANGSITPIKLSRNIVSYRASDSEVFYGSSGFGGRGSVMITIAGTQIKLSLRTSWKLQASTSNAFVGMIAQLALYSYDGVLHPVTTVSLGRRDVYITTVNQPQFEVEFSGDIFFTGLTPGTTYALSMQVNGTNAQSQIISNCTGSPSESVYELIAEEV